MNDKEKLAIYDRNQRRLIKALLRKQMEDKYLMTLSSCYAMFLTDEQQKAARLIAEAMLKKEMMQRDST